HDAKRFRLKAGLRTDFPQETVWKNQIETGFAKSSSVYSALCSSSASWRTASSRSRSNLKAIGLKAIGLKAIGLKAIGWSDFNACQKTQRIGGWLNRSKASRPMEISFPASSLSARPASPPIRFARQPARFWPL